jgi:hypothetical protein
VTPDDYMEPRPNKPISRVKLAMEAAHWAAVVFTLMLSVLSLAWAMEITAPDHPQHTAGIEQIEFGSTAGSY